MNNALIFQVLHSNVYSKILTHIKHLNLSMPRSPSNEERKEVWSYVLEHLQGSGHETGVLNTMAYSSPRHEVFNLKIKYFVQRGFFCCCFLFFKGKHGPSTASFLDTPFRYSCSVGGKHKPGGNGKVDSQPWGNGWPKS